MVKMLKYVIVNALPPPPSPAVVFQKLPKENMQLYSFKWGLLDYLYKCLFSVKCRLFFLSDISAFPCDYDISCHIQR